jgi:hypothetical protein
MASRAQSVVLYYTAWNTSASDWQTGDAGNHTLRLLVDGVLTTPTNSPSEPSSTYLRGIYSLTLSSAEATTNTVLLGGISGTSDVKLIPIVATFEQLPTAAPATSGGLPTVDASNGVKVSVGTGAGQLNVSSGKAPATLASSDVTGNVAADIQTIKTQMITCAAGVTVLASVGTAATDTAQTGDSYVRLGAPIGASLSADIAAVKTDTGNLVMRVTATLFSGITSLAQWLGLLAGKQAGDSTARVEVRATGAGSGTYNETTDSQEAIRDRGDVAWATASGFSTSSALSAVAADVATVLGQTGTTGVVVAANGIASASFAAGATIPRCTLTDTLTTYAGNVPQTGDSFVRIGATGSGLTSLAQAATALSTAQWTSARADYLDTLSAALAESYAADGASATLAQLLYMTYSAVQQFSIIGSAISLYEIDGVTVWGTVTTDSATTPTRRMRSA